MPQWDSDKTPVTFQDVANCFSEEEWKLLHKWQKELYKNVMKEIRQALLSLGPLIATAVYSLKPKQNEEVCSTDQQVSERRQPMNHSSRFPSLNSDNVLRGTKELKVSLMDDDASKKGERGIGPNSGYETIMPMISFSIKEDGEPSHMVEQDSERRESTSSQTGHEAIMPIISFSIKEDGEPSHMVEQDSERKESINSQTGFPSLTTESEASFMDNIVAEEEGSSTVVSSENDDAIPIVSVVIKEEGETSSLDDHGSARRASISRAVAGDATMNRKGKAGEFVKCTEKISPSQLWSESFPELGGENIIQCEIGFRNETHSIVHQRIPNTERSERYYQCESNVRKVKVVEYPPKTQQNWSAYTHTESVQNFNYKEAIIKHHRSRTAERRYPCNECEKSFSQMKNLIRHQKIHIGERPYQCTECEKSFSRKGNLIRHQRTHCGGRQWGTMFTVPPMLMVPPQEPEKNVYKSQHT